jgi:hypothetical protein
MRAAAGACQAGDARAFAASPPPTGIPLLKFGAARAVTFPPSFRSVVSPAALERGALSSNGERTVTRFVLHFLLYSCTLAFVTGVVLAAAKFII